MKKQMIGTQVFGLYQEMAADFEGTFDRLAQIGFDVIEPLVFSIEKQEQYPMNCWSYEVLERGIRRIGQLGMQMPSVHVGVVGGEYWPTPESLLKELKRIHSICGAKNFVFSGMFTDAENAELYASLLGPLAAEAKADGYKILFHAHNDEFTVLNMDGGPITALDYFCRLAGEDVLLQMDIGWARFAGDEVEISRQYADRIVELHFKDFNAEGISGKYTRQNVPKETFMPIGEGEVRTEEVIRMSRSMKNFNGLYIIDQDMSGGDMMEDLRIGYRNIARMLHSPA